MWKWLVLTTALLGGCLEATVDVCDGVLCPPGQTCSPRPTGSRCVVPEQLSSCAGAADGETCSFPGVSAGACLDEVCLEIACGNGVVQPGEACDDGNTEPHDECSATCTSDLRCGNGLVDAADGEACDCGDGTGTTPALCSGPNSDEPDATCSTDCEIHGCGDDVVSPPEDCEPELGETTTCQALGFYQGGAVSCQASCRWDDSPCEEYCGDGIANGLEDCDGADVGGADCRSLGYYDAGALGCSERCSFIDVACTGFCGDRVLNGGEGCDGTAPEGDCVTFGHESGALGCALCGPDFSACRPPVVDMDVDTPVLFEGVWGSGPDDVYAITFDGDVFHYDGAAWSSVRIGFAGTAVTGTGPADVFAVGLSGGISHFDGAGWSLMTSGTSAGLHGVWAIAPDDVFAVGDSGTILHYNGTSWSAMTSGVTGQLFDVWGTASDNVYASGIASGNGVILHFDGATWTSSDPGAGNAVLGLGGSGPNDVFAVGGGGAMRHFDGSAWTTMASGTGQTLYSVRSSGATHAIAVGENGAAVQFDGATWTPLETRTTEWLQAVWVNGPGDAFAVGWNGTIVHWDGAAWAVIADPNPISFVGAGVWASAADDVVAVGAPGDIRRFDGSRWTRESLGGGADLKDVWGVAANDVFAVGALGRIVRYDGTGWSEMTSNTTAHLDAVWASASGEVFAVGASGTILHYDGAWSETTGFPTLFAVWGSGPDDVFAVGGLGAISHFDGTSWSTITVGTDINLRGVWGTGPDDVFAVGEYGKILHYDGSSWTHMSSGSSEFFQDVWGTGPADVFALSDSGGIVHWDGTSWSSMRSPVGSGMHGLSGADGHVFATGVTSLRLPRTCAAAETVCDDGVEDDCDGLVDCADPDCDCTGGGPCADHLTIACGDTVSGSTAGAPSRLDRNACDLALRTGRERVYQLVPPTAGDVTVTASGIVRDVDLVVLAETASGGCDPVSPHCLGASAGFGTVEQVTFAAEAGAAYYVVVDGYGSYSATFTLDVSCP